MKSAELSAQWEKRMCVNFCVKLFVLYESFKSMVVVRKTKTGSLCLIVLSRSTSGVVLLEEGRGGGGREGREGRFEMAATFT